MGCDCTGVCRNSSSMCIWVSIHVVKVIGDKLLKFNALPLFHRLARRAASTHENSGFYAITR